MEFPTQSSPYLPPANSVTRLMVEVKLALIPGALCLLWFFGWGLLLNLVIATATAVAVEAAAVRMRGKAVLPVISDGTAALTGLLLGLALPPLTPWWIPFIGAAFAILLGKQVYGGMGYNPFNPAMVGYVVLIVSFPLQMTLWTPPRGLGQETLSLVETLALSFTHALPAQATLDSITMATPLDTYKTQIEQNLTWSEISAGSLYGSLAGIGWQWVNLAFLVGGLWLWRRRAIHWQIPFATLAGLFVTALLFYVADADRFASPVFHLFSGATMLGAFFIATDPVSAATTPRGRLWYGAGVGVLVYVIRVWGGYPDGVAFAVLLMNMAAPTIDFYTQPRVFGHKDSSE